MNEFTVNWKKLNTPQQEDLLQEPWKFKQFAENIKFEGATAIRSGLLHLVHPDTFEPIMDISAKDRITKKFAESVAPGTADIDQQLLQIRQALTPQFGQDFSWYSEKIRQTWEQEGHVPVPGADGGSGSLDTEDSFQSLMTGLRQRGLHFSPELVSNYLLALQTRRFVILSGISGTGKTQLAIQAGGHREKSPRLRRGRPIASASKRTGWSALANTYRMCSAIRRLGGWRWR